MHNLAHVPMCFPCATHVLIINFSDNSIEMEDASEAESRGKSSSSPLILDEYKTPKIPEFSLTLLQTQPKCEVYPDLHKIVQVLSYSSPALHLIFLKLFL